jgi:hypothetical protein
MFSLAAHKPTWIRLLNIWPIVALEPPGKFQVRPLPCTRSLDGPRHRAFPGCLNELSCSAASPFEDFEHHDQ